MTQLKVLTLSSLFILISCQSVQNTPSLIDFQTITPEEISGQIDEPYELALQNYFDCQNKQSPSCQLHLRMARDTFLRTAYLKLDAFNEQELIPKGATLSDVATAITNSDQDNTAWLRSNLSENIWFASEAYGSDVEMAAWLLVQHSDHDREFQKSILRRLEPLLTTGSTDKNRYALLYDRVAVAEDRMQKFGTQGRCDSSGEWKPAPMENESGLDERRAEYGLPPIVDYASSLSKWC